MTSAKVMSRVGSPRAAADDEASATRQRLLDAAGGAFAEFGFERARVREICARARANVAAIKYHFGGKFELYEAAIGYWFAREPADHPVVPPAARRAARDGADARADGESRLRAFVAAFLTRLLDRDKPAWHARLMAREMVEPTGVLDRLVEQTIRPTAAYLHGVVRQIVGPDCPSVVVERAVLSVIAQCVFYVHCRPVLERVAPAHAATPDIAALAGHVAAFSVAGVRAVCRDATRNGRRAS